MIRKKDNFKDILLDIVPNSDKRGETIKIMTVQKTGWPARDVIVSSIKPKVVRGKHYHKAHEEVFVLLHGKVAVNMINVKTGQRKEIKLDGQKRKMLFIHPYVSHSVKNIGKGTAWFVEVQNTDYDKNDDFKFEMD